MILVFIDSTTQNERVARIESQDVIRAGDYTRSLLTGRGVDYDLAHAAVQEAILTGQSRKIKELVITWISS